jgi:hypothetical protein
MLTDDQKAFFMDMENLFNSPGWARLNQGWLTEMKALPEAAFFNSKTIEELDSERVRLRLLSELVGLPQTIEQMKEAILNPQGPQAGE